MNTGDMEKYCPKPHPVYFNAFSMWQQLSGSVQYLINMHITFKLSKLNYYLQSVDIVCKLHLEKHLRRRESSSLLI